MSGETPIVACAQVRGGNGEINVPIELPGLRGVLHSRPSEGGQGGDVYFLSVCGSGLLTRICIADLVGHGERVSRLSSHLHQLLSDFVNWPDHRRILQDLNESLMSLGIEAMTTAAMLTYYPPTRTLTYTYAGHPPGWYYRSADRCWSRLNTEATSTTPEAEDAAMVDGVLGVTHQIAFTRSRLVARPGDRLLLITDGVLETPNSRLGLFGSDRLQEILNTAEDTDASDVARTVLAALTSYNDGSPLEHDDVTILVVDVIPGPKGPALWHVVRNRVLRPLGLARQSMNAR